MCVRCGCAGLASGCGSSCGSTTGCQEGLADEDASHTAVMLLGVLRADN